jgi:hypothetical protein
MGDVAVCGVHEGRGVKMPVMVPDELRYRAGGVIFVFFAHSLRFKEFGAVHNTNVPAFANFKKSRAKSRTQRGLAIVPSNESPWKESKFPAISGDFDWILLTANRAQLA